MLSTLSVPDRTGACLLHHGFISVSKQWRNPDTTWAMVVRDKDNVLLTFSIVMASASHKGAWKESKTYFKGQKLIQTRV